VVPARREVADCLYLAHASTQHGGRWIIAAVAASVNWVTGGQLAPLTERADPPTEPVVSAEWMLAHAPMEAGIWRDLGVTHPSTSRMTRGGATVCPSPLGGS
jgi:hypothetical protein